MFMCNIKALKDLEHSFWVGLKIHFKNRDDDILNKWQNV